MFTSRSLRGLLESTQNKNRHEMLPSLSILHSCVLTLMAAKGDVRRRLHMDHVKTNQMDHRNCVRTRERAGKKTDRKIRFSKPADLPQKLL